VHIEIIGAKDELLEPKKTRIVSMALGPGCQMEDFGTREWVLGGDDWIYSGMAGDIRRKMMGRIDDRDSGLRTRELF